MNPALWHAPTQAHISSHKYATWLYSAAIASALIVCVCIRAAPCVCECGLLSGAGGTKSNQHNELQAPLSGIKRKKNIYMAVCGLWLYGLRACVCVCVRWDCTHTTRSFGRNTARNNAAGDRDKAISQDQILSLINRFWMPAQSPEWMNLAEGVQPIFRKQTFKINQALMSDYF